jgi:uncharacterized peroxidase-related enzyme
LRLADPGQYSRRVAHIPLPDGPVGIRALFAFRPEPAKPMAELANILLHAPNSLTAGERELIAAYVSSLNQCRYCLDSHAAIASWHFGNDEGFVRSVVNDPESAVISDKLKALLDIAARVQQSGTLVRSADIERARQRGATDLEMHDTVLIAAVFCMFNRYVDGLAVGTFSDPASLRERAKLVAEYGYTVSPPQPPA